jgi:MFS family permease
MSELSEHVTHAIPYARPTAATSPPWRLYSAEALAAAGTNLLITAIYFYTADQFHWNLKQNFLLASGQGLFYVAGALTAGSLARWVSRPLALALVYAVMALLSILAFFAVRSPVMVTALLLLYSFASTLGWPILESLASSGVDSHALSRRIATYNFVWASVSIAMLAIDGTLIVYWPSGIFLVPFGVHAVSSALMFLDRSETAPPGPATAAPSSTHAPEPEPELLRVRTLALWLSRVALPATYVVLFSLMALMPSLAVVKQQTPAVQTLLSAVWMVTRVLAFLVLGVGTWWHTRPRLLLVAAILMLVAFFGITVRPSDIFGHGSAWIDLTTMVVSQLALGAAVGMIYAASLYFGMVLSDGSTEHGGYHEALIGVGFIVGPAAGALAQIMRPGDIYAGIFAVGAVVFVSVVAVVVTSIVARGKEKAIQA